jgi:hypothetical protein
MLATGHTYHFPEAPEFYLVDDNVHVVDRIKGEVALHKIYPAAVLDTLRNRARHVKNMAELIEILGGPLKVPKRKKTKKHKKRK